MNAPSPTTKAVTLTADQQAAADAFYSYLMSDETIFVLSGSAGTGKTYLLGHLCDTVLYDYADACQLLGQKIKYQSVHFTATTNKAAEVLENAVNRPVKTIHSFLGLKVVDNYKTGKSHLQKTKQWRERSNEIIFIDEYSTIDRDLFKLIVESLPYCKIVFVGDHAQMPPVNDPQSPVNDSVTQDCFAFLSQQVRNAGSPALMSLCNQLRETVETGVFKPMKEVPGVIEYLDDEAMQQKLDEHFQDLDPSCRVLCHTNPRVAQFNEHIRQNVRKMTPEVQVGDVLVVGQPGYDTAKNTLNVEREIEVIRVDPTEQSIVDPAIFDDGKPMFYNLLTIVMANSVSARQVRFPTEPDKLQYAKKYYAKQKDWVTYFALKDTYVDLRDKAACTVYKAQGSTYDTVFIDIGNIGTSFNSDVVARMLFVAVSRARSKVYFFGRLPGRYVNSHPN